MITNFQALRSRAGCILITVYRSMHAIVNKTPKFYGKWPRRNINAVNLVQFLTKVKVT